MTASLDTSPAPTLVIGAGGAHGGTGSRVADRLRRDGRRVRVLVRADDERAQRLREIGAEIVVGDLLDRRTLDAAAEGVHAVYFAYPVAPGIVEAAANLAAALRSAATAPRLVVMSMAVSAAESPSGLGRAQWAAEEVFDWAGLEPIVLRIAALFFENIPLLHGASIRRTGTFANSFGEARVPWISGRDAADLAVAALTDHERHPRGTTTFPRPAILHSHSEIAALISAEIGNPVCYNHIPARQWRSELEDRAGDPDTSINISMAQHISTVGALFAGRPAAPPADDADLARALGHRPRDFPDFIRAHREQFIPAHRHATHDRAPDPRTSAR